MSLARTRMKPGLPQGGRAMGKPMTMATQPFPAAQARIAGLLYLIIIVCGVASEAAVRGPILVPEDANATLGNLLAHVPAFRVSVLADAAMAMSDVGLAVLLYAMLKPVNATLAAMATAFRLVQAAILGMNLLNLLQALSLATTALPPDVQAPLVLRALQGHAIGYDLGLFFFAINCMLTAALLVASGFVPRAIGYLIGASGVVYLVGSTLRVLAPQAGEAFAIAYVLPLVAELAFCLWLLSRRSSTAQAATTT